MPGIAPSKQHLACSGSLMAWWFLGAEVSTTGNRKGLCVCCIQLRAEVQAGTMVADRIWPNSPTSCQLLHFLLLPSSVSPGSKFCPPAPLGLFGRYLYIPSWLSGACPLVSTPSIPDTMVHCARTAQISKERTNPKS